MRILSTTVTQDINHAYQINILLLEKIGLQERQWRIFLKNIWHCHYRQNVTLYLREANQFIFQYNNFLVV